MQQMERIFDEMDINKILALRSYIVETFFKPTA
jgi:hypothetical protein